MKGSSAVLRTSSGVVKLRLCILLTFQLGNQTLSNLLGADNDNPRNCLSWRWPKDGNFNLRRRSFRWDEKDGECVQKTDTSTVNLLTTLEHNVLINWQRSVVEIHNQFGSNYLISVFTYLVHISCLPPRRYGRRDSPLRSSCTYNPGNQKKTHR